LYLAVEKGHGAVVQALINYNADPNLGTKADGTTPLIVAAHKGLADVTEVLIRCGVS
jgi:ankyrin repeat protein